MLGKVASVVVLCSVALIVASCSAGSGSRIASVDPLLQNLPAGWTIEKSFVVDPGQTAQIGAKLGTPIKQLSNNFLVVEGQRIQINILEADNPEDAARLQEAIGKTKGDPGACRLKGLKVIEYVGDSSVTADFVNKVSTQLGL